MVQQEARHRFVDAALDRTRIVVDRHAGFAQRMQDAQTQRHLLEGAARDAAHEHGIRQRASEAWHDESVRLPCRIDAAIREIDAARVDTACAKRFFQAARVPAGFVGHDRDARARRRKCHGATDRPPH